MIKTLLVREFLEIENLTMKQGANPSVISTSLFE